VGLIEFEKVTHPRPVANRMRSPLDAAIMCAGYFKVVAAAFLPMMEKLALPKGRQAFVLIIVVGKQTVQRSFFNGRSSFFPRAKLTFRTIFMNSFSLSLSLHSQKTDV
jgi:hypothetical protein